MLQIRPRDQRGRADHGWLNSWHSFSFADYHDPQHMSFGPLRVINEDRIQAGSGFGKHGHRDMEIISYVLSGALAHEDSMGNRASIVPGEIQIMSAGNGVMHSEFNHNAHGETHFLQIWIIPDRTGGAPSYQQKMIPDAEKRGQLRLMISPDGRQQSLKILQDAQVYAGLVDQQETITQALDVTRLSYLFVARGTLAVNGEVLQAGDAAMLRHEPLLTLEKGDQAEVLFFDLPS